jgi:hypothetical protein
VTNHQDRARRARRAARTPTSSKRLTHLESLECRLLLCIFHEAGGTDFAMSLLGAAPMGPTLTAGATAGRSGPATGPSPAVKASSAVVSKVVTAAAAAATVSLTAPTTWATAANGLPLLNSLPGAPTAIYLDFDGDGSNTPYSEDADATTYNATEQANIVEAWRQVAAYFAMFDTNVTTQVTATPKAWEVIGNNAGGSTGGYAFVGTFPNSAPNAFNTSSNARSRQSGMAHEIGHVFGLWHQSTYDALGNKTNEYVSAPDPLHGAIMGVDYSGTVHKWDIGHPSSSVGTLQDDVAVIAGAIRNYESAGGNGFRPDDFGNTIATATPLASDGAGTQSASGIIERMSDVDAFSFVTTGGGVGVTAVPPAPSGLDARLDIYDALGNRVATADAATNDQRLTLALPAGTYYALVSSHGDYADLGEYDLTVRALPAGWAATDVGSTGLPGYTVYNPATGAFTSAGAGAGIIGATDQFHFTSQFLTGDGEIVARVTQNRNTAAAARVGLELRDSLADNAKHASIVLTPSGGAEFTYRTSTGNTTIIVTGSTAALPRWLRLTRVGNLITGYASPNGSNWTQVGQATITAATTAYVGLLTTSGSTTALDVGKLDSVSVSGNTSAPAPAYGPLPAPAGLIAAPAPTGTGVALSWGDVPASSGFVVQRSSEGVTFAQVGTTAAGVTSYTDPSPGASQRYYYRVAARDTSGNSAPSAVASAVNRPGPVTGLSIIAWSTTSLIVDWRDVSGDTGYRVERSSDGGATFAPVATLAANVPSYTDSGLTSGASYVYRVVTLSPAGDSAPSATITGTPRLQAVTGTAVTSAASNSVALRWNDLPNETGYRIDRSSDGTSWSTVGIRDANETSFVDATVAPLAEYYYRVYGTAGTGVGMDPTATYTATPAATSLPTPWAAADIGTAYGGGGSGASGYAAGTFTLIAGGSDIWGNTDSFRYTYQPLNGDGEILARVASIENTNDSAKVAVMIRSSLAPGAQNVAVVLTRNAGVQVQTRSANNGSTTASTFTGIAAPYWLRLKRAYNSATGQYTLTGYDSADGVTWTQLGNAVTLNMPASAYIGLATTSHDTTRLMTATVTNVALANTFPSITTPAAANPAAPTSDQFALSVLGSDDHGESNLTYTWAATTTPAGAKATTFAANGTNAAKATTATVFAPGTYKFTVTITDASGLSTTSTVTVTVPTAAFPAVTAVAYDFRQTFAVTFNADVGASLSPDDLAVLPLSSGTALTPDGVRWDAGTKTATFWFDTALPVGDYRATLAAASVADTATVHPLADTPYDFFVLPGDANRDRAVNFADLLVLAKNYNGTNKAWADGDFTGDGTVNFADLLILAKAYNQALPAAPPAPAAPFTAASAAPLASASPADTVEDPATAKAAASLFNASAPARPTPPPPSKISRPARRK